MITSTRPFDALQAAVLHSLVLPPGHFFEPNEKFWSFLTETIKSGVEIVECGSGDGFLLKEAKKRKLKLDGCDTCKRTGQSSLVEIRSASSILWHPLKWPLICRPDHSGWAGDVFDNATAAGAWGYYIGLGSNYHRDIGHLRASCVLRSVGNQGENIYLIRPRKKF